MNDVLLHFKHVGLQFPGAPSKTLVDIDLTINRGEFITILGQSGSGKTTLIKLANRLLSPSVGQIFFEEKDIAEMNVSELRMRMGYVIQQVGLFPHMTIEENIGIVSNIKKIPKNEIKETIDTLLLLTKLPNTDEFKRRHPWQLSGGQQQRVGLARALCSNPDVLLMDEPFGALDAITRKQLQTELQQIQKKYNKTILFVTHDLQEAISLGERVLVLNQGVVQQFDTPRNLVFNPANDYLRELCSAKTLSQKLRYFKVKDFNDFIEKSTASEDEPVDYDDSMEMILERMLNGVRQVPIQMNGLEFGTFNCDLLESL